MSGAAGRVGDRWFLAVHGFEADAQDACSLGHLLLFKAEVDGKCMAGRMASSVANAVRVAGMERRSRLNGAKLFKGVEGADPVGPHSPNLWIPQAVSMVSGLSDGGMLERLSGSASEIDKVLGSAFTSDACRRSPDDPDEFLVVLETNMDYSVACQCLNSGSGPGSDLGRLRASVSKAAVPGPRDIPGMKLVLTSGSDGRAAIVVSFDRETAENIMDSEKPEEEGSGK